MTKLVTDTGLQKALELVADKMNNPLPISIEYSNNTAQVDVDTAGTKHDMIESPESTIELNGRTLVNLWGSKEEDFNLNYGATFSDGFITASGSGNWVNCCSCRAEMFKPNTIYTIVANIIENTLNGRFRVNTAYLEEEPFGQTLEISSGEKGIKIYTLTSKADISTIRFGLRSQMHSEATAGSIKFQCIILEGDYTDVPVEYFEGLKSAGETEGIEVKSTGKNLFKLSEEKIFAKGSGCYNMPIGSDLTKASVPETVECIFEGDSLTLNTTVQWTGCKIEFPLIPNTQYTFTFDFIDTALLFRSSIYEVDSNYTVTRIIDNIIYNSSKVTDGAYKYTFTTSSNATKGVFAINRGGTTDESNTIIVSNIQLEKGTEATPYEPYKEQVVTLPEIEPLRSLPNGICDEAFIHDDKLVITRKVGKQVVNNLTVYNTSSANYKYRFYLDKSNCDFNWSNEWLQNNTIGNNYKPDLKVYDGVNGNYAIGSDGIIWICDTNYPNIGAFSEYLGTNPFELCHPLKTYLYEWYELPSPHLYKEGNIFVETGAIPLTSNSHDINVSLRSAINTNVEEIIEIKEELNTLDLEIATQEDVSGMWQGLLEGGTN